MKGATLTPAPPTYAQLERNFVSWAEEQADIRSAIVIGSRARREPPADEWSDLDVILYTTDPAVYAATSGWLSALGEVWLPYLNDTFAGEAEWLVLFAGGLKADFILSTAKGPLQQTINQSPYQVVLRRGMRVLFDKDAPDSPLTLPEAWLAPPPHPTQDEFLALANRVFLSATRAAKLLKRGELWGAKYQCDTDMKRHLLTMLEWQARATHGSDYDPWYDGRYLDQWADPQALANLPATFAAYDASDLWRALFATLDLFRCLAIETAELLDYSYPTQTDRQITSWLASLLMEKS